MNGRFSVNRLIVLLMLWSGLAFPDSPTLNNEASHHSLNQHIEYLIDPTHQWTLEQALGQDNWQPNTAGRPLNLGFTPDPVWVKGTLNIPAPLDRQWYLVIEYPLLEQADLYLLKQGYLPVRFHIDRQHSLREQDHTHGFQMALPLPMSLEGQVELVLRAQSSTSLQLPLALWREDYLHNHITWQSLLWGGYFGVLFALVVYNLFLFSSIRDAAYGYYVLYLGSLAVLMLCVSGVGVTLFWPMEPSVTRYALPISTGLLSFFAVLFARAFLRWPGGVSPGLERGFKITAGLSVLLILYTLINPVHGAQLAGLLGGLVLLMLIIAGLVRLRAGVVIARYFVAAWAAFTLGGTLYLLNVFGLLPVNALTNHAIQIGSVAEVLLLSFALAHRIKEERARKLAAYERQKEAESRIREMEIEALEKAVHDPMTSMPNAALLNQRLQEVLEETDHVALVIVHYPQVRQIALNMGHNLAESMFKQLALKLNATLADSGVVTRLEGLKATHLATLELGSAAFLVNTGRLPEPLDTLVEGLVDHYEISVNEVSLPTQLNMHCGIAVYPDHGEQADTLYKHAWAALDSSARIKCPVQIYSQEISAFAERRLALMSALLGAIEAGELSIYLQPQIDCSTEALVGAEVLLRWFSPTFGQVPTWEFIEIAENSSLMEQVTGFVVSETIETIERLQQQGLNINLSINLSVQNLKTDERIRSILDELARRAIPTHRLIVEVTETAMMQSMDAVIESLSTFTQAGGKVALDDFGTGYSSLAYLSRLPIHELKIDNSFIANLRTSNNDVRIVENTIKLARTLGLGTVAEGIEDREVLDMVRQLGCERAQGYYFSRPVPVEAFCKWALQRQVT